MQFPLPVIRTALHPPSSLVPHCNPKPLLHFLRQILPRKPILTFPSSLQSSLLFFQIQIPLVLLSQMTSNSPHFLRKFKYPDSYFVFLGPISSTNPPKKTHPNVLFTIPKLPVFFSDPNSSRPPLSNDLHFTPFSSKIQTPTFLLHLPSPISLSLKFLHLFVTLLLQTSLKIIPV